MKRVYLLVTLSLFFICSCDEPQNLGVDAALSGCGGFFDNADSASKSVTLDDTDPPKTEFLNWTYDATNQHLSLHNTAVCLNCCGDHGVAIFWSDEIDGYEMAETDFPEAGDTRCNCICPFDFSIAITDLAIGVINLKLTREVSDQSPRKTTVWHGKLNLNQTQGTIEIGPSCH